MQDAVETAVRFLGCGVLFLLTAGRYRGPYDDGLLAEGGAGVATLGAMGIVAYGIW